jgi:hypothetical protein
MRVTALDGRAIEVHRRLLPWKPRLRDTDPVDAGFVDLTEGADDPAGFVVAIVLGLVLSVVLALLLPFALLASEFLLVVALLVPLLVLARLFWMLPWVIEAVDGDTRLGVDKVRGWRASSERVREIAAAYERGQDPFATAPV